MEMIQFAVRHSQCLSLKTLKHQIFLQKVIFSTKVQGIKAIVQPFPCFSSHVLYKWHKVSKSSSDTSVLLFFSKTSIIIIIMNNDV